MNKISRVLPILALVFAMLACVSGPHAQRAGTAEKQVTATETPLPTATYSPEIMATIALRNLPHLIAIAYDHIPNHAPGTFEIDPNSSNGVGLTTDNAMDYATDNNRYAYFEQYVCRANYVDLRGAPMLTQPPRAYVLYGDVVHVHERFGAWAMIDEGYWIELKYLCDF